MVNPINCMYCQGCIDRADEQGGKINLVLTIVIRKNLHKVAVRSQITESKTTTYQISSLLANHLCVILSQSL